MQRKHKDVDYTHSFRASQRSLHTTASVVPADDDVRDTEGVDGVGESSQGGAIL